MGVLAKARLGSAYTLTGGVFRSSFRNEQNFAELFVGTTADGLTREQVIADPGQNYASTSGELQISRIFAEGPQLHALHATVRARQVESRYGGAAPALNLGPRWLDEWVPISRPDRFALSEQTHDQVRQVTVGAAYEGRWRDVGEVSLGIQRKTIDLPGALATAWDAERPWLANGAAAVHLSKALALHAGRTRGLEESGLAPASAANRNAALPAIRTTQSDAGVRWTVSPRLKLVAGVFDIRKPYFNTDEANVYTVLGDVRHRGVELSLSGAPTDAISLVAGAVLIKPRVTGAAVELGRVGERPLGQPTAVVRGNLEYRPPAWRGFSVDLAAAYPGRRPSSRDNLAWLPAYGVLDIGARYRFRIGDAPATLRLQVANVTNSYAWSVSGSNSYGLMDRRRALAFLVVDF